MPKKKKKDEYTSGKTENVYKKIEQNRDTRYFKASRKDETIEIPKDCNFTDSLKLPDIFNQVGRREGEAIIYSPTQAYNYYSQSERYDRSLKLVPSYIKNNDAQELIYGFCSSNSGSGYWEVRIPNTGTATYIKLTPSILTIICPRPFLLSELVSLESDSTTYKWSQISGNRTVLIEPDNVANPTISIQNTCFTSTCNASTLDPIRLRVETDNFLIFTDLVILNQLIDNFDGLGFTKISEELLCAKAKNFIKLPDNFSHAYCYSNQDIVVSWSDGSCYSDKIINYEIQELLPPYTTILVTTTKKFTAENNKKYRIKTNFKTFDREFSSTEIVNVNIPDYAIFADELTNCLGVLQISVSYAKIIFTVVSKTFEDAAITGLGATKTYQNYTKSAIPTLKTVVSSDDNLLGLGTTKTYQYYQKVAQGGVIVG